MEIKFLQMFYFTRNQGLPVFNILEDGQATFLDPSLDVVGLSVPVHFDDFERKSFTCIISYLDPRFGQIDFQSNFLSHEYVWIACLLEQSFQYVQLLPGERGPLATLLARVTCSKGTYR